MSDGIRSREGQDGAGRPRRRRRTPSTRRERALVLGLAAMVGVWGAAVLVETLVARPGRELQAAVAAAEGRLEHQRQLLVRAEGIRARYRDLEAVDAAADSALTETGILRELSGLAGRQVHVKSVVPRPGTHAGQEVMLVALDCEGTLAAVVAYVEKVLARTPSEVASLALSSRSGADGQVTCRLALRVGRHGP
ncbi:MAG: hypothetical protein R6X35_05360 [Candidatus Krumholzibacteriia bacterium]